MSVDTRLPVVAALLGGVNLGIILTIAAHRLAIRHRRLIILPGPAVAHRFAATHPVPSRTSATPRPHPHTPDTGG